MTFKQWWEGQDLSPRELEYFKFQDRHPEGSPPPKSIWNAAWQAARQPDPLEHAELHEPMTDEFKLAWKNGLPLDSMEAKWAFVGWQAARATDAEAVACRVTGSFTDMPFRDMASAKAYCRGLLSSDPEGGYKISPLYTHPPAKPESAGVPEGWRLVPVEPTTEMRKAYHKANERYHTSSSGWDSPDYQWSKMLETAPNPPTNQESGDE